MTVEPENQNIHHETTKDATNDLKYCFLQTGPNEYWYHTHCSWGYHMKGTQTCEVCDERGGTNWLCVVADGKPTNMRVIACKVHTIEVFNLMRRRCT
jgi:hypothetical protein